MFVSEGERLLKRIFGFDKASGGTVGGIAGAYATGAVTGALTNMISNPLHPFGGGRCKREGWTYTSCEMEVTRKCMI